MDARRLVENHNRWLMGYDDIRIVWYQFFRMIIGQPKELDAINLYAFVLQKMDILRQILYPLSIPQTQIVIASHEDFVLIWQLYEPVQEVQHLILCTIMADVTTMDDDISLWHVLNLSMKTVSIREVQNPHL